MELDKRIIEGKRPLTCFDVEEAKKYIGKECYFASKFESFENLSKVTHATLHNVDDSHVPFQCYGEDGVLCFDCFILPCEWVEEEKKEPKFRPYKTPQEMFDDLGCYVGDIIHLRTKTKEEHHIMVVGYSDNTVTLGNDMFNFNQLFAEFELRSRGEWQPFGVEE